MSEQAVTEPQDNFAFVVQQDLAVPGGQPVRVEISTQVKVVRPVTGDPRDSVQAENLATLISPETQVTPEPAYQQLMYSKYMPNTGYRLSAFKTPSNYNTAVHDIRAVIPDNLRQNAITFVDDAATTCIGPDGVIHRIVPGLVFVFADKLLSGYPVLVDLLPEADFYKRYIVLSTGLDSEMVAVMDKMHRSHIWPSTLLTTGDRPAWVQKLIAADFAPGAVRIGRESWMVAWLDDRIRETRAIRILIVRERTIGSQKFLYTATVPKNYALIQDCETGHLRALSEEVRALLYTRDTTLTTLLTKEHAHAGEAAPAG